MVFQLFTLVSNNPFLDYSYCALSKDDPSGPRLLLIAEDLISLEVPADESDLEELYKDYLPTSRKIEYDLSRLEEMIRIYTNQETFKFHAYFDDSNRVGLTFGNPPNGKTGTNTWTLTTKTPLPAISFLKFLLIWNRCWSRCFMRFECRL